MFPTRILPVIRGIKHSCKVICPAVPALGTMSLSLDFPPLARFNAAAFGASGTVTVIVLPMLEGSTHWSRSALVTRPTASTCEINRVIIGETHKNNSKCQLTAMHRCTTLL